MNKIILGPSFSFLIGIALCVSPTCVFADEKTAAEQEVQKEVQSRYAAWCAALSTAKGDASKITSFYAGNAIVLPPLSAKILVKEKSGLEAYYKKLTEYPNIKCKIKEMKTRVYGHEKWAVNSGEYTISYNDPDDGNVKKEVDGDFSFVYQLVEGKWLIVHQHTSTLPDIPY